MAKWADDFGLASLEKCTERTRLTWALLTLFATLDASNLSKNCFDFGLGF